MIVRVWRARASEAGAAAYRSHFETVVRPELRELPGFEGAELLLRPQGGEIEIAVQTRWASMDAVRAFAGRDPERAVVEPGARAVLLGFDDRVAHYEVALAV